MLKGGLILVVCIHRLRGNIVQYDITDPENPKLAGRVWLGGCCRKGGPYKVWCCPLTCRRLEAYTVGMQMA